MNIAQLRVLNETRAENRKLKLENMYLRRMAARLAIGTAPVTSALLCNPIEIFRQSGGCEVAVCTD